MSIDIDSMMMAMKDSRPIFHSEADFQHSLAWEIHKVNPDARIRLEYPVQLSSGPGKVWHLDIFVVADELRYAIELKYATARTEIERDDETFNLRDQSAADLMCYSYCADIERIEQVIQSGRADTGFAIILGNQPYFWTIPLSVRKSNHDSFRIHEGSQIKGTLEWASAEAKSYQPPIILLGHYQMNWKDYHTFESQQKYSHFKYSATPVRLQV